MPFNQSFNSQPKGVRAAMHLRLRLTVKRNHRSRSNRETSRLLFLLRGFQLFDVPC
jgi:hypothetical protein